MSVGSSKQPDMNPDDFEGWYQSTYGTINDLKLAIAEKDRQLEDMRKIMSDQEYNDTSAYFHEELDHDACSRIEAELKEEISAYKSELAEKEERLESLLEENKQLELELESCRKASDGEASDKVDLSSELESAKATISRLMEENAKLKAQGAQLETELEAKENFPNKSTVSDIQELDLDMTQFDLTTTPRRFARPSLAQAVGERAKRNMTVKDLASKWGNRRH